jgi:hypothetical protein
MDGTSVVALTATASRMAQERSANAAQLALLKRALALSSETALALLQAAAPARPHPSHLGNHIDTWA